VYKKSQPVRLYQKAVFTGFRRGKTTQSSNQALLTIENCNDTAAARWYLGKRVAYIFKAASTVNNTRYRVHWGRIINTHGNSGVVRARFLRNLPPQAIGATLRVMLYPNRSV
jgi:large subunit ribosomal protein L35Ae